MPVYIIKAGETEFVKIGWAVDPEQRLRELQCAHYEPLLIIRVLDGGPETEAWMHRRFCNRRKLGEWFIFDAEMLAVVPPHAIELRPQVSDPLADCLLTNRELAEKLSVTPELVRMWRSGARRIPAERAVKLSELTGISCHELRPDLWKAEAAA